MKDRCRVSEDELRHDEEAREREKYLRKMSTEEIAARHMSMETITEGIYYLNDKQQEKLTEACVKLDLPMIGLLVSMGINHYIQHCIDAGGISEYEEEDQE